MQQIIVTTAIQRVVTITAEQLVTTTTPQQPVIVPAAKQTLTVIRSGDEIGDLVVEVARPVVGVIDDGPLAGLRDEPRAVVPDPDGVVGVLDELHLAHLDADAHLLGAAAALGLEPEVPCCPGWTVADLLRHVTRVHASRVDIVSRGLVDGWPPRR